MKAKELAGKTFTGLMCFDERGPFIFYDKRYFPNLRKSWDYGKPPELVDVTITIHSKGKQKRGKR